MDILPAPKLHTYKITEITFSFTSALFQTELSRENMGVEIRDILNALFYILLAEQLQTNLSPSLRFLISAIKTKIPTL